MESTGFSHPLLVLVETCALRAVLLLAAAVLVLLATWVADRNQTINTVGNYHVDPNPVRIGSYAREPYDHAAFFNISTMSFRALSAPAVTVPPREPAAMAGPTASRSSHPPCGSAAA